MVTVSAIGTLSPVNEVQVGIEVSGTIEKVYAYYNDRVKVGQVLAKLDIRMEAQTQQSKSALELAKTVMKCYCSFWWKPRDAVVIRRLYRQHPGAEHGIDLIRHSASAVCFSGWHCSEHIFIFGGSEWE